MRIIVKLRHATPKVIQTGALNFLSPQRADMLARKKIAGITKSRIPSETKKRKLIGIGIRYRKLKRARPMFKVASAVKK